ncbi:hypothetical protein ABTL32_19525, partial [Acinetobacter baumannii]
LDQVGVNFTRNGAFSVDTDRYVVDGSGNHLLGYPVDGSGAVVASSLSSATALQLPPSSGNPVPTGTVALTARLPANGPVPTNPT